jgi:hypothetical protein
MKHIYEFRKEGELVNRMVCDSQEELIKCMQTLQPFQEKHFVQDATGEVEDKK